MNQIQKPIENPSIQTSITPQKQTGIEGKEYLVTESNLGFQSCNSNIIGSDNKEQDLFLNKKTISEDSRWNKPQLDQFQNPFLMNSNLPKNSENKSPFSQKNVFESKTILNTNDRPSKNLQTEFDWKTPQKNVDLLFNPDPQNKQQLEKIFDSLQSPIMKKQSKENDQIQSQRSSSQDCSLGSLGKSSENNDDLMNFKNTPARVKLEEQFSQNSKVEDEDEKKLGDFGNKNTKVSEAVIEIRNDKFQYQKIDICKQLADEKVKNNAMIEQIKGYEININSLNNTIKKMLDDKEKESKKWENFNNISNQEISSLQKQLKQEKIDVEKKVALSRIREAVFKQSCKLKMENIQDELKDKQSLLKELKQNYAKHFEKLQQQLRESSLKNDEVEQQLKKLKSDYNSVINKLKLNLGISEIPEGQEDMILKEINKIISENYPKLEAELEEIKKINFQMQNNYEKLKVEGQITKNQLEKQQKENFNLKEKNKNLLSQSQVFTESKSLLVSKHHQELINKQNIIEDIERKVDSLSKNNMIFKASTLCLFLMILIGLIFPNFLKEISF